MLPSTHLNLSLFRLWGTYVAKEPYLQKKKSEIPTVITKWFAHTHKMRQMVAV